MCNFLTSQFRYPTFVAIMVLTLTVLISSSHAQEKVNEKQATASKRAIAAVRALNDIAALPAAESVPREVLERARVIAVFPNVSKINAIFQKAMKGSGFAVRRTENGWGTPVFYQFGVIDSGWTTAEAKSPTIIMFFLNESAANDFKENQISIGSTVDGPIGKALSDTDKKLIDSVRLVAYGYSNGKLVGVKIEEGDSIQSGMHADNAMNKPTFGAKGPDVFYTNVDAKGVPEIEELRAAVTNFFKKESK